MCFNAANTKKLIAKRDVPVYKILYACKSGKFCSPYRKFNYKKGVHYYQTKPIKKNSFTNLISEGLHAYTNRKVAISERYQNWGRSIYEIIKMYIPTGAIYYKNSHSEVVSSELVWYN